MNKLDRRNMIFFGLGTVGRDMFYAFEANALIYYLSNVLDLPIGVYLATSLVFTVLRIFDALNDPFMGLIIDNSRSKYGKFKPPMLLGAIVGAIFYLVLFTDFGIRNYWFVAIFGGAYLLWDIFYGLNDIAYWSMLPSLSLDQKVREKMGAFARICANVGMFAIMVGWMPITNALGNTPGAWFTVALTVTVLMILFQLFTVFGVKEKHQMFKQDEEKTSLREMWHILTHNDQLLWTTLSMSLFMIGYMTTTTISPYYMQYVFGNADMYAVLAAVVGVAQLSALGIFSSVSKRLSRENFYLYSTILVAAGYGVFMFADGNLPLIVVAALLLFVGQAFIQLLMLMFLSDTIEYGQWKLGRRNESLTLSVQPLINKIGGAISMGFVSISLVWAGIKTGDVAAVSIDDGGKLIVKLVMLIIPLIFIVAGYLIYRSKYKIDKKMYDNILAELHERGELHLDKEFEV
ncbi:MAG: glycoside-pentoside-hexuronide (GPH):cation symporter [Candidatus Scatomorpha sp.]|jgi:sugar (glycoside-pentoside-hexuronide) transporter